MELKLKILIYLLLLISPLELLASEIRPFYQSFKSIGMGNAYLGISNNPESLYLNPAGMASVEEKSVYIAPIMVEASTDFYSAYKDSSSAFSSFGLDSINALNGKNVYGRAQLTPSFVMPNFGVGLIIDGQMAYYAKNTALPNITFAWQNTNGIQASFGMDFTGRRPRKGAPRMSVGVGLKMLWRRGGYRTVPLTTILNASSLGINLIKQLSGNFGVGYGIDLGAHYSMPMGRNFSLGIGTSFLNIGNISFASTADSLKNDLGFGAALVYDAGGITQFTFAFDHRNILNEVDWRARNHFGIETKISQFSFQVGLNQVYLTGGVGFDYGIGKIYALTYAHELGALVHQDANRRYMIGFDFKFSL